MIEVSDELRVKRARAYMRLSIMAFVKVALMDQARPVRLSIAEFGKMMAAIYRDHRIKNKFYEVV